VMSDRIPYHVTIEPLPSGLLVARSHWMGQISLLGVFSSLREALEAALEAIAVQEEMVEGEV